MGEVFIKRSTRRNARLFEFNHHPWQSVYKTHQVGATGVERPRKAELADQQKIVVIGVLPIHNAQALGLLPALGMVRHRHRDALFEQAIHLAVGGCRQHGRAVPGNLINGVVDGLGRHGRVQPYQCRTQPHRQHHLALGLAPQRAIRAKGFFHGRHGLPAQVGKQANGRLLHQLVFGVGVNTHEDTFLGKSMAHEVLFQWSPQFP